MNIRFSLLLSSIALALCSCSSSGGEASLSAVASRPPPEEPGPLFELTPVNPQTGESFVAVFDSGNERGGYFTLSRWENDAWSEPAFLVESDVNSGVAYAVEIDGEYVMNDYGISGPGPDGLVMPEPIDAGYWRICTANSLKNVCAQLLVE